MRAYSLSSFNVVVGVEGERVSGKFLVLVSPRRRDPDAKQGSKAGGSWVSPIDVTIWNSRERRAGIVLRSDDFTASVVDGVAALSKHQVSSNRLDDVLDVWDEMLEAVAMAAEVAEEQKIV